jgi:molybdopterin-guanine dinucleotide biosynthesis protein A
MAAIDSDADVVIARTSDGLQPMPAIYRRSVLPAVEAALAGGRRAVTSLFELVDVQEIGEAEVRQHDPDLSSFLSINEPWQLERARACASCN